MADEKVPPQSIEAEQSVLGSVLIDREAIATAAEVLEPEDFYRESHRLIYDAALRLFERSEAIDVVTVSEKLKQIGKLEDCGGITYLGSLANSVPTAANVEYYAKIVEEKAILRHLVRAGTDIVARSFAAREDAETILDEAQKAIFQVAQKKSDQGYSPLKQVLMDTIEQIEYVYAKKSGVTGIPTGFKDLDELTAGLQTSDLIVVAARPSMGKTMLCLNILRNAAVGHGIPGLVFSLEMSKEQVAQRLLCAESGVDSQRLRTGFLTDSDWTKISHALGRLSEAPIYIDDTPSASIMEIRAKARRLKVEKDLGLVIIDYLQLVQTRGKTENRQQEISDISRSMKALARELKVPVIAVSQLSRAVEQRNDKKPLLSDLRESGAIEQDADVVAFIYRDEYYNRESDRRNIAEIIVAKQRNGPTDTVELVFLKEIGRFVSIEKARAVQV
jgi:replicative DNA helicase